MAKKATKPVASLSELRYKMAEKIWEFENGEISEGQINAVSKAATVIVNTFKVEIIGNQVSGNTNAIDFVIGNGQKKIEK